MKKILVDLDPTKESQPALDRGIYLAKQYEASLTLFLVVYNRRLIANTYFNSTQLVAAKKGYINTQRKWVEKQVKIARDAGIEVDYDIVWGKPIYESINQKADAGSFDLVIKSTHIHPTINKVFFTPNDWQLLKTSEKPIILAKSREDTKYHNVMAAIDPSNRSEHSEELDSNILRIAREIAASTDAIVHAAHCYDPIAYQLWSDIGIGMGAGMGVANFAMGQDNYDEYIEKLEKDSQTMFEEAVSKVNFPQEHLHLEEGYPEKILPELVDNKSIDLLVMGTSYHSGLIGSTIEKILDDVDCDVMAVRV